MDQPLLICKTLQKLPLPLGEAGGEGTRLMIALPCLVLFFLAQKYFVRGIVMSGIKG